MHRVEEPGGENEDFQPCLIRSSMRLEHNFSVVRTHRLTYIPRNNGTAVQFRRPTNCKGSLVSFGDQGIASRPTYTEVNLKLASVMP